MRDDATKPDVADARLFDEENEKFYARERDGELYRLASGAPDPLAAYPAQDRKQWSQFQQEFIEGAVQGTDRMLEIESVRARSASYARYFARRGPLAGDVLDIGGGWGLFREWWTARSREIFVVHDPGTERFLRGPYDAHREVHERAFERPMIFVEGWGERLPYPAERFDTIMSAAALDHCIDPPEVFRQAFRCLKRGGAFLAIEHIEDVQSVAPKHHRLSTRLGRIARDPARVIGYVKTKLKHDPHIHHFTSASLQKSLRDAGFMQVSIDLIDPETRFVAIEGKKPFA